MIPICEPSIGEEELANVVEAVRSGWVSSKGNFIIEFEEKFARYCGVSHGVATANGTVALHLALVALGIGAGHEVIVPSLTFIATANAVRYAGAKPVLVDSHPDYWCLDPAAIERAITPKTKAIIPVHLYGHPCDMEPIADIAKRHHLYIIEDAAESHGAEYKGRKVGSLSDIACFSFYGNKIITTGEGGMCLSDDEGLVQRMRVLRDHGATPGKPFWHDVVGFNYRMTNLQAALGVAQLQKIDTFVEKKRLLATWYGNALKGPFDRGAIQPPPEMPWAKSVYWMYTVLVAGSLGIGSGDVISRLRDRGIEARPVFYPVEAMPMYRRPKRSPVAEDLSQRGLSLPSSVNLTAEQVRYIGEAMGTVLA